MSSPSLLLLPEIQAEIHENERAWIGGGFSKKGLLPNDRGRFSTPDGTQSWKTIEEASEAMLGKGWTYMEDTFRPALSAEQEYFTISDGDNNEEGWHYARDFTIGAIQNSKPKRSKALHWVRYRRLIRMKKLDPLQFLSQEVCTKCDHCDSETKGALSMKLLEVLAFITLVHNGSHLSAAVALPWKTKLLELIDIGSETSKIYEENAAANITSLHRKLEAFAEAESTNPRNVFSKISNVKFKLRYNESLTPGFADRCRDVSCSNIFPKAECDALAGLIIRHLDPKFQLHCNKEHCGELCMFAIVPCTNEGCDVQISRKHLVKHRQTCPYEIIECPLGCGDKYARNMTDKHKADICALREIPCPFANIGCTVRVLARDLPEHVGNLESTNSHLLLAVNRMMEYQKVIKNMNGKISTLEDDSMSLKHLFATHKTQTDNQHKEVTNKLTSLSKKVNNMESSSRKEFQKIKQDQEKHMK